MKVYSYAYPCGCAGEVRSEDYGTHTAIVGSSLDLCPKHAPAPDDYGWVHDHVSSIHGVHTVDSFAEVVADDWGVTGIPVVVVEEWVIDSHGKTTITRVA